MAKHARIDCGDNDGSSGDTMFARAVHTISEKTTIPFKVLIPIASLMIFVTYRLVMASNAIERKVDESWTINDMNKWARKFERDNPTVKVPEPQEIFEDRADRKLKLIHP